MRSLPPMAVVAAGLLGPAAASAQGTRITIPDEYKYECEIERTELRAKVVAANPAFYPKYATRVDGGWLFYDEYEQQVIEVDDELRELRRWGRRGPGPLEYENPVAAMRLPSGEVLVVDNSPPSFMLFGGDAPNERRLDGLEPEHAMIRNDGTVLVAGLLGELYAVTPEAEILGQLATRTDLGMTETMNEDAAYPVIDLKPPLIGFRGPSTVWILDTPAPRMVLQRCVPAELARVHERAPKMRVGDFGMFPFTIETLVDFLPLANGYLAFGGLKVNDAIDRSIERYDASGTLVEAWRLTGYPGAKGRFDPHNPKRILIWNKDALNGLFLVEVADDHFPGGP